MNYKTDKIELFPQQTIERLIKNSVEPKRNKDGVIMISKDEMSYEEWEGMIDYCDADTCTKCTVKPIAKEHMCEECYESHSEWLRELSAKKCTYCDQKSEYQQGSYNLCQRCADKVNNLILGKPKQVDDDWYTLYESNE